MRCYVIKSIILLILMGFSFFQESTFAGATGEQSIDVNRILEKEAVSGKKPDFSTNSCSFAIRVKFLEKGGEVNAANSNAGMIFSVASGYYEGARAWYSWDNHAICFEIGKVTVRSSISVNKGDVMPDILHDLVCTYDGKVMKIYLNGELGAETAYSGNLVSLDQPIKIGFTHNGIGWNKMFVDQLDYYPRAMTPEEVAARFKTHPELEKKKIDFLKNFQSTYGIINLNNKPKSIENFVKLFEDNVYMSNLYRDEYRKILLLEGGKENVLKAAPLVEKEANDILSRKIPQKEDVEKYNQFVSNLYQVSSELKVLHKITGDSLYNTLENKLNQAFPYETKIKNKVQLLESQMLYRAHKLEADSLARFEKAKEIPANVIKLFLAPNGSDSNDGSKEKPLATLAGVLEKANRIAQLGKSVLVIVADGRYYCEKTALIENKITSNNSGSIIVRAEENARPIFTGNVMLQGFTSVRNTAVYNRFSESVRDKIVVCDLKKNGVTDFGAVTDRGYPIDDIMNPWTDLYINGQAQTLARWPNEGEEQLSFGEVVNSTNTNGKKNDSGTFRYDYDRPQRWYISENPDENDIWANGLFQYEWAGDTRKVLKIDQKNKLITVDYKNLSGQFHYYLRNILEELDVPGEFYIDRTNGLLYLYPPPGIDLKKDRIEISVFSGPFIKLIDCSKYLFQNLTFSGCRTTAFWAQKSSDCYLDHCLIDGTGVHAVVMTGCSWGGVYHSKLCRLGGCGVRFTGGDRTSLTPSGLTIYDTEIASFCQVDRAYAAAVQTTGCGMTATNNLIYDSPHHAFRMDGNDQYCARNEVHSVVYEYSDQSGIDIYCDPMYRGIVIEKNFWHHIGSSLALCGQAGIRLDDSISGVVMADNIFYRSSGGAFGGIQIHGGKDNLCIRNLFVCCKKAFSFSPWGNDRYLRSFIHGSYGTNVKNYLEKKIYPFVDEDLEVNINRNFIFNNDLINCEAFQTNGTRWDQFYGNTSKTIDSVPTDNNSIPTPQKLRQWIEQISGRSLKEIGLVNGQNNVKHFVSPHYSEK